MKFYDLPPLTTRWEVSKAMRMCNSSAELEQLRLIVNDPELWDRQHADDCSFPLEEWGMERKERMRECERNPYVSNRRDDDIITNPYFVSLDDMFGTYDSDAPIVFESDDPVDNR
jgi:hypothetical protein